MNSFFIQKIVASTPWDFGLNFWIKRMIFDEFKTRGVKDVLLTCCDNLNGISEALKATFPNVHIQKCVIHQIRNSTKHVSPKDVASFTSDMKKIINHKAMMQLLKHLILLKILRRKISICYQIMKK